MSEEHKREFQGTFCPSELLEAFTNKEITMAEFILLQQISSYVRNGKDERGCFASNKYLAKIMGMTEGSISNVIASLKKKKWILQTDFDGRKRYIITKLNAEVWLKYAGKSGQKLSSTTPLQNGDRLHYGLESASILQCPIYNNNKNNNNKSNLGHSGKAGDVRTMENLKTSSSTTQQKERHKKQLTTEQEQAEVVEQHHQEKPTLLTDEELPNEVTSTALNVEVPCSFELKYAKRLHHLLETKGKISRKVKVSTWEKEIRKLLISISPKRFVKVYKWYKLHIQDEYTPKLYKVSDLSTKFDRIEEAMKRESTKSVSPTKLRKDLDPSALTEKEKWIYDKLKTLHWPKGSDAMLPAAVQESYRNIKEISDINFEIKNEMSYDEAIKSRNIYRTAHRMSRYLGHLQDFVKGWFEEVYTNISNWEEWSGNLSAFVISLKNEQFVNLFKDWFRDYFQANYLIEWDMYYKEVCKRVKQRRKGVYN